MRSSTFLVATFNHGSNLIVEAVVVKRRPQTRCEDCPIRKNENFREFSGKELDYVRKFKAGELAIERGATVFLEGTDSAHLFTVLDGWAFRYKMLEDGRRQILNYALPGDLLGLQASIMGKLDHSVEALTDVVLCVFQRDRIWELYQSHPGLAFDTTWLAAREERLLDENLLSVGRRTAEERISHMLLSLAERARRTGLTAGNRVKFPITQHHLADTLGLSLVHTNKTLRKLVNKGVIRWQPGELQIKNSRQLSELAKYQVAPLVQRPFI